VSKVSWHKSASKDVRPFFGAATLEHSVDAAEIRLYEDTEFSPETAFLIEPADAQKLAISVKPNLGATALSSESIKTSDLALAITVLQPFLKKTTVVGIYPVSGKLPEDVSIGDEVLDELGGGGNVIVEVALCLAKKLPKKPGSPFLLGHWLSKKSFALRAPKQSDDFNILPMDDDAWKQIGWPAKTMYSVEYLSGFNEPAAKDRQLATVRVHADIHKKLTVESNQRLAKPMMATLAAEITAQLIASSFSDWEHDDEVVALSPLSAFLKKIDRIQTTGFEDLKKLVKEPGMPKLKALLHADQQSVRFIAEG
jgi:hypothetical protein